MTSKTCPYEMELPIDEFRRRREELRFLKEQDTSIKISYEKGSNEQKKALGIKAKTYSFTDKELIHIFKTKLC